MLVTLTNKTSAVLHGRPITLNTPLKVHMKQLLQLLITTAHNKFAKIIWLLFPKLPNLPSSGYNYLPPSTSPAADLLPPSIPVTDIPEVVTKNPIIITTKTATKVDTIPVESSSGTKIPQITSTPIIPNGLILDNDAGKHSVIITTNSSTDTKIKEVFKNESMSHTETNNHGNVQVSGQSDSSLTVQSLPKALTEIMDHYEGSQTEINNHQEKDAEVKATKIDINQSSNSDVIEYNDNKENHNIEHHIHHYYHNNIQHLYDFPHIDYYHQHNCDHYRQDISHFPKIFNPYKFFTVNYGFLNNNNNNKNHVSDNIEKSNTKPCNNCINSKVDPPKNNLNFVNVNF